MRFCSPSSVGFRSARGAWTHWVPPFSHDYRVGTSLTFEACKLFFLVLSMTMGYREQSWKLTRLCGCHPRVRRIGFFSSTIHRFPRARRVVSSFFFPVIAMGKDEALSFFSFEVVPKVVTCAEKKRITHTHTRGRNETSPFIWKDARGASMFKR